MWKWHYDNWKGGRVFPQKLEMSLFGSTREWDNNYIFFQIWEFFLSIHYVQYESKHLLEHKKLEWDHDKCKGYIKKVKISILGFGGEDLKSLLHIKRHVMAIQKTCHL
jgi:hypothetical protein